MKEDILNLLKHNNLSINKIKTLCNLEQEEAEKIIQELVDEKRIFLNTSNKYQKLSNEYLIGTLEKTSKGSAYVMCEGKKILIPSTELKTALKNDLVVVEKTYHHCGTIKGILKRKNNKLVCEVKEWKNKLMLVPFNVTTELHLVAPKELLSNYIVGDRVFVTLGNDSSETNDIFVREITKIGHFNDRFNDEIAIAISKDFEIDFSDEALKEADKIPQSVQEYEKEGRLDLTDENIFTIDSIHTKDMDDAISIKKLPNGNYELGVHIADVAHYIKPNSYLFKEALSRGTSVYLGDVVIPMIPSILSNGICSLNENVERLTKSCIMEINKKGKVINYRIVESVIKSKKKMTYEDINTLFDGGEVDASYYPFLNDIKLLENIVNAHINNTNNPHSVTKAQVGLGNVDNTSDQDKPVSTAQQAAINAVDDKLNANVHIEGGSDEITYVGDTVTKVSPYKNLKTGVTGSRSEVIKLADNTHAGMMSHTDYATIRSNTQRIERGK